MKLKSVKRQPTKTELQRQANLNAVQDVKELLKHHSRQAVLGALRLIDQQEQKRREITSLEKQIEAIKSEIVGY